MQPAMRALAVLLLCLASTTLLAQPTVVGGLSAQSGSAINTYPITFIDLGRPVNVDGVLTHATFIWDAQRVDCGSEIRIKVFRAGAHFVNGTLTLVNIRGPFTPLDGVNRVTFDPITVKAGDFIAVSQYASNPHFPDCGGIRIADSPIYGDTVYQMGNDYFGGGVAPVQLARHRSRLQIVASGGPLHFGGVIPVVGSTAGRYGSFFRSTVTLTNDSNYALEGRLIYHPAQTVFSGTDPRVDFSIPARSSVTYPDFVADIGRSGLGTLDLYTNGYTPTVTVRVFNDEDTLGTAGFTEEMVRPLEMFGLANNPNTVAVMPIVHDTTFQRMNVGIRTLGSPATVVIEVWSAVGVYLGNAVPRTYPANYFEQVPMDVFISGLTPPPGGMLRLFVTGGPAAFYTTTTDNRTNDSSMNMVTWQ